MYAAPVFVDSRAAVPLLPDVMYRLPNVTQVADAGVAASPTEEARREFADEVALCRLRRLQGDLALVARLRQVAAPAAAANQRAPAAAANQRAPAAAANQRAPAAAANQRAPAAAAAANHQAAACPESLSLHCRPDAAPAAALALLQALRQSGKLVHVTSHLHSAAGACRLSPELEDAVRRLEAANPQRRAGSDLCVSLVWRSDLPECSLAADAFGGHPLLGEAPALRAVNLAAGRPLPEDWPLLDFADQQLGASAESRRRLEQLLAGSDGQQLTLGKIFLVAELRRRRQSVPKSLAEVEKAPAFAEFAGRLLPPAA